ncbi:FecR family protein [Sphingomonas koreensis]
MESNALPMLEIAEAARLWAIRASDPGFSDWDAFTLWLEESPAHLTAYETALAQADEAAELLAAAPRPAWQPEPETGYRPPRRRWFAGAAVAAAVAAVAGWGLIDRGHSPEQIATAPGERRIIDLADGSRVILNGNTRVTIDRDTPRHVELAQGEALFEVRHDEANPFLVVTGNTRLLDAGTVFNVIAEDGALDVEVAEGAVIYQPGADQVRLDAGDGLSRARAGALPVLRKASPQNVGGWRSGALYYDRAPLDRVAQDLERNLGQSVKVEGSGFAPYTGALMLNGSAEDVLARAAPLLGVRFTAHGKGWVMSPANGSPP